jgi:hypothetical protein
MRKNIKKKLVLRRETLRVLRDSELKRVVGGSHYCPLDKLSVNVCPVQFHNTTTDVEPEPL